MAQEIALAIQDLRALTDVQVNEIKSAVVDVIGTLEHNREHGSPHVLKIFHSAPSCLARDLDGARVLKLPSDMTTTLDTLIIEGDNALILYDRLGNAHTVSIEKVQNQYRLSLPNDTSTPNWNLILVNTNFEGCHEVEIWLFRERLINNRMRGVIIRLLK